MRRTRSWLMASLLTTRPSRSRRPTTRRLALSPSRSRSPSAERAGRSTRSASPTLPTPRPGAALPMDLGSRRRVWPTSTCLSSSSPLTPRWVRKCPMLSYCISHCFHPRLSHQSEKRSSGGDTFNIRVVSTDGKFTGISRVTDLHNGMYEGIYSVPVPGTYQVCVLLTCS